MDHTKPQRLLSLDVLRGITIAGMILVNNPGNWSHIYEPLRHASWNGLTPTDLVFPFFMFIMGISTYISLKKYDFKSDKTTVWKMIKRTAVIFLIGLLIAWTSLTFRTWHALAGNELTMVERLWESVANIGNIRILGVMQRLALCYCATAIIAITVRHRHIPALIVAMLAGYFVVLIFGKGFEYNDTNIVSIVDRAILGVSHMYKDNGIEPEGLLSTIPAIAHVLIGFYCGKLLMEVKDIQEKMLRLFIIGTMLTFVGFLLSYACPVNKKIWSPSFVLATCGLASLLLALLIWIIDVKKQQKWCHFFNVFGINPLFIYVMGAVVSILMGNIRIAYGETSISLHAYMYKVILQPLLGDYPGSLAYAILVVVFCWAIGYMLYKKNIYIKI